MRITSRGLRKNLEERVAIGNYTFAHKIGNALFGNEPTDVEAGVLLKDDIGFYINVVRPQQDRLSYHRRIKHGDMIAIPAKPRKGKKYDVRFYQVDLS